MIVRRTLTAALFAALAFGLSATGQPPASVERPADLARAAATAPDPVAALFRAVSRPADRVQLSNN